MKLLQALTRSLYRAARVTNDLHSLSSPKRFVNRQLNKRSARIAGSKLNRKTAKGRGR